MYVSTFTEALKLEKPCTCAAVAVHLDEATAAHVHTNKGMPSHAVQKATETYYSKACMHLPPSTQQALTSAAR
jgi:hypothetical protein